MTAATLDGGHLARPSLLRLSGVELRKTVDTRSGFWLVATVLLLVAGTVVISVLVDDPDVRQLDGMFEFALAPITILLPILGILAVTTEWSQRTTLTTFSLVPGRERVTAAKVLATSALAVAGVVVCLAAAAVGNLVIDGSWALGWSRLGTSLLVAVISMLGGVAFGLVFLSSPAAIVCYFVLPTGWAILGETIGFLDRVAPWLDTSRTTTKLAEDTMSSGGDWARLGTSLALWLALPLAIGLWRVRHSEVK
jgi:ABC-2 type transport system permease protein